MNSTCCWSGSTATSRAKNASSTSKRRTAGDGYIEFKEFMAWWTNWATQLWNTRLLRNPGLPTEQALRMARAILSPPLPEGSIAFA